MRTVIQRVISANATEEGEVISSIGKGLCILVGIFKGDTKKDIEYLVRKILNLRIFESENGNRWSKNVKDLNLEILCLSQITLCYTLRGNKPDFRNVMAREQSHEFYSKFLEEMRKQYVPELVKEGKFGAYITVGIQNDGPVTIVLDSPKDDTKTLSEPNKEEEDES